MARNSGKFKSRLARNGVNRPFVKQIHIFTEGTVTEVEYLQSFKELINKALPNQKKFKIEINSSKGNSSPKNLRLAIRRAVVGYEEKSAHEVWAMIDQDNWPPQDIALLQNDSSVKRKVSIFDVLISKPKFELWLILHFESGHGVLTSSEVDGRLQKHIGRFDKHWNTKWTTSENVQKAVSFAKELVRQNNSARTDVYKLIEHILDLAKQESARL